MKIRPKHSALKITFNDITGRYHSQSQGFPWWTTLSEPRSRRNSFRTQNLHQEFSERIWPDNCLGHREVMQFFGLDLFLGSNIMSTKKRLETDPSIFDRNTWPTGDPQVTDADEAVLWLQTWRQKGRVAIYQLLWNTLTFLLFRYILFEAIGQHFFCCFFWWPISTPRNTVQHCI